MKRIILSIRFENNLSFITANDKYAKVEFNTSYQNVFVLLMLIKIKLFKEKINLFVHHFAL